MELTFLWLGEEIVLLEALEDFADMFLMGLEVLGVYQNVIQIDDNTDIEEIHEDTIDKSLKSHRGVSQAEGQSGSGLDRRRYQGCQHSQCAFSEFYVAQYPVNQWIVVGEPTMSKY